MVVCVVFWRNFPLDIKFGAFIASLIALVILPRDTIASAPVTQVTSNLSYPTQPVFQVFEDAERQYSFETIEQLSADNWQEYSANQASFGFTQSPFWLRLTVLNDSSDVKNFILELDYVLLDHIEFRAVWPDGTLTELITGDTKDFYPRHIDHPSNLFQFQLQPQQDLTIVMCVQTEGSMILPVYLWEQKQFFETAALKQKFQFYYYGAVSVIILINLAVFLTLRERLYLYYSLAITGYLVFFGTSRGYIHQLLLSELPQLNSRLFLISMPFLALFSLMFARQFLKSAAHSPRLDLALKGMIAFECINLLLAVFAGYDLVVRVSAIGAVLLFSVLFIAGPITMFERTRAGAYFVIAWTPLTVGFFATSGRTSGFLPNTFLTEYAMQIGSGIEAVVLTMALADRLYRERENKIKAQENSLTIEKQRSITQSRLTEAMSRDPVTQLSNRNRFEWLVEKTIKEHPDNKYVVVVANMTRVGDITRTLGLSSAERILKSVARHINDEISSFSGVVSYVNEKGENEGVYQLSRETFGALVEQAVYEDNPKVFFGVLEHIAEPIEVGGMTIDLSPIYGSALYPEHGTGPTQLIRNALIALQDSRNSKGMLGIFHEKLDIYDKNRLTLVTELKEALEQDSLELFYQPKLDIATHKVVGMEALARWIHPSRGFIPPDQFIGLAEETGVINQLTLWAFERALKDFTVLQEQGYEGSVSVNISARDLLVKNVSSRLKSILSRYAVPAERVYLEVTETGAMEDPELAIATLNKLSDIGLKISIDDFGTGYSSLSYLQRLPATEIKLDRSLINEICTCESTSVIVKTSIDMVHALGYTLVAEGVEDEPTVRKLAEYQCDTFQGYWSCKPKPLSEIQQWLSELSV